MKLKRLLLILPFLTACFGQTLVPLDSLPTGLVYLTRSPTGAITWEGVELGDGLTFKQDANGKRLLVATQLPILGMRVDWGVLLVCSTNSDGKTTICTAPNVPYGARAITVQVAPNGVLTVMSTGFTINGNAFIFSPPIPAGNLVMASYFF